jgi:hypothetical protein
MAAQGALVGTVSLLAYRGMLGSWLPDVAHLDLLLHFSLVGLLAFFLDGLLGYRPVVPNAPGWLRLAPLLVALVGAGDELAQRWSPHRSASWSDLAANVVGIACFSWLSRRVSLAVTDPDAPRAPGPKAGPP